MNHNKTKIFHSRFMLYTDRKVSIWTNFLLRLKKIHFLVNKPFQNCFISSEKFKYIRPYILSNTANCENTAKHDAYRLETTK